MRLAGDHDRRLVPICERAALVSEASRDLGYPGGDRLYQLLKTRYYWKGMRLDCLAVCQSQHAAQVEHGPFFKQPRLSPTFKERGPFAVWCVDLVTKLEPVGPGGETVCIVAVCPFTKFVLADPLPDKSSSSTMKWLHARVVCMFGVPLAIRVDQGTEFKGLFQSYCDSLGVKIMAIYTAHPQANGLVERYNGVIRAGLRKLSAANP